MRGREVGQDRAARPATPSFSATARGAAEKNVPRLHVPVHDPRLVVQPPQRLDQLPRQPRHHLRDRLVPLHGRQPGELPVDDVLQRAPLEQPENERAARGIQAVERDDVRAGAGHGVQPRQDGGLGREHGPGRPRACGRGELDGQRRRGRGREAPAADGAPGARGERGRGGGQGVGGGGDEGAVREGGEGGARGCGRGGGGGGGYGWGGGC